MKLTRLFLALIVVAGLSGVAYVAQQAEPTGSKMGSAAETFVASLTVEQKAKAVLAFDDQERMNWNFIPLQDMSRKSTRKGLPLEEMTGDQRQAALALLRVGTSAAGNKAAETIMSLENILRELEKGGAMVRDPNWYFFTVFGKPSRMGKWGWRVEGHHLSLNFTLEGGQVVSATPAFFGANPATVKAGPRKGLRALAEAEDLAIQLLGALDDDQRKIALQQKQFEEVAGRTPAPKPGAPRGLPAAKMTEKERDLLWDLLESFANRMPADIAATELARVKEMGVEKVHFAFAGGIEPGQPHTYRIQGPTFVVEFLNIQPDSANNPANHIHSAWRSLAGDFGVSDARGLRPAPSDVK